MYKPFPCFQEAAECTPPGHPCPPMRGKTPFWLLSLVPLRYLRVQALFLNCQRSLKTAPRAWPPYIQALPSVSVHDTAKARALGDTFWSLPQVRSVVLKYQRSLRYSEDAFPPKRKRFPFSSVHEVAPRRAQGSP